MVISMDDFIDDYYNTSAGSSEYARMHSGEFMLLFLGNIFLKMYSVFCMYAGMY